MGKELEYKLEVGKPQLLEEMMKDPRVEALKIDAFSETAMRTSYYDSPDQRFSKRHWTLRQRQEGEQSVICVKTPTGDLHTRGEWQIEGTNIDESAVIRLIEAGAPRELLYLYGAGDIAPVCGAQFLRKHAMLRFSDGSEAELACDQGQLIGKTETMPLCEAELELYQGDAAKMLELVAYLCQTYGLKEQPRSKVARARSLK